MFRFSTARRIVSTVLIAVLLFASASITSGDLAVVKPFSIATADCLKTLDTAAKEKTVTPSAADRSGDSVDTKRPVSHIAEVTLGELDAIIEVIKGNNPNENKDISDRGQNSKNNILLSLLYLFRNAKAVKDVKLTLEPFENSENIKELCLYYKELFDSEEIKFRTGLLFNYDTEMVYTADGTGLMGIGFDFNFDFDNFYASDDPWQRNFGFCDLYDKLAFLIGDYYDTIKVKFTYDDRDWMIQVWKGIYSYNMLGAELGIYVKPQTREAEYYDCVSDPDRLVMSFDLYHGDKKVIGCDPELSWWKTAFVIESFVSPSELTMHSCVIFPDKAMRDTFVESLKASYGDIITVTVDGLSVSFTWPATK